MAGQSRGTGSVPALLSSLNERGARRFVANTHRGLRAVARSLVGRLVRQRHRRRRVVSGNQS